MQLETRHFISQYSQQDSDVFGTFIDGLENAFDRICEIFHFDNSVFSCPYFFNLCPNVDSYMAMALLTMAVMITQVSMCGISFGNMDLKNFSKHIKIKII